MGLQKAYQATFNSFKKYPQLFFPFLIFTALELIALLILYFAPQMPLVKIFGPPIRTFWGERFLHYPLNFFLLPKLLSLARMGLTIFFGSLLTAMAVAMVDEVYNKKTPKLGSAFRAAFKKYVYLFVVVALFTLLFYFLNKLILKGLIYYFVRAGHPRLLFWEARFWLGPFLLTLNFLLAIFIQSAFIYAIPLLIIEKEKLMPSIRKSFVLFKNLFIPTLLLVTLPMLLYVPVVVLQQKSGFLIERVFPESILLVLILDTVVTALVIDPLITVSATVLFLLSREKEL